MPTFKIANPVKDFRQVAPLIVVSGLFGKTPAQDPNNIRCRHCGKQILPRGKAKLVYCSIECERECMRIVTQATYKSRSNTAETRLNTCQTGARSELCATCDLMSKGYEVFRALSPSSSCDLVIIKNGGMRRVEVRTAIVGRAPDEISFSTTAKDRGRQDIFAGVVGDQVFYFDAITLQEVNL
jgi:hypothetical protein